MEDGKLRSVHTLTHLVQANFRGRGGGQVDEAQKRFKACVARSAETNSSRGYRSSACPPRSTSIEGDEKSRVVTRESLRVELASPTPASWNQVAVWLRQIDDLRQTA